MTTDDLDVLTQTALADLDAAPDTGLTPAQQQRADATLAAILGDAPVALVAPTTPAPRRRWRRVLLTSGAVAASAAGLLVLQQVMAGDTAYASWTARPTWVASADELALGQVCRDYLGRSIPSTDEVPPEQWGVPADQIPTPADLAGARVLVAEQRGAWRFALLAGPNGFEATCMMEEPGWLGRLFGEEYGTAFGMVGIPRPHTPPAADGLVITNSGAGSTEAGTHMEVTGQVGADVVGLTFGTPLGDVEASVREGRFAAWWPDRAFTDAPAAPGSLLTERTVTVHLRDGRVLRDLPATRFEIPPDAGQ